MNIFRLLTSAALVWVLLRTGMSALRLPSVPVTLDGWFAALVAGLRAARRDVARSVRGSQRLRHELRRAKFLGEEGFGVRLFTGVVPKWSKAEKVGRPDSESGCAPPHCREIKEVAKSFPANGAHGVTRPTFRVRGGGAHGVTRPTIIRLGQHALTSAATGVPSASLRRRLRFF